MRDEERWKTTYEDEPQDRPGRTLLPVKRGLGILPLHTAKLEECIEQRKDEMLVGLKRVAQDALWCEEE